jgi:hypothetical protein
MSCCAVVFTSAFRIGFVCFGRVRLRSGAGAGTEMEGTMRVVVRGSAKPVGMQAYLLDRGHMCGNGRTGVSGGPRMWRMRRRGVSGGGTQLQADAANRDRI